MHSKISIFPRRLFRRGMAISETLVAVAVMLVTCSVAYQQVTGVRDSGRDTGRTGDVKMLNKSVSTYLQNGGSISAETSGDAMLLKMKQTAAETKAGTFAGLKGPFIDVRLKGVAASAGATGPRIVWDAAARRFSVAQEGSGWSSLIYDASEAIVDHGTEVRQLTHNFAQETQWVWDYADHAAGRKNPARVPQATPTVGQMSLSDALTPLAAPVINPSSGTFDHHAFPLSLSISNPNAGAVSDVLYQINGGAWLAWQGAPVTLEKRLTTTVTAFAQAREMSDWTDSGIVSETYITYFMRGQSSGVFVNQTGDNQFAYSVSAAGNTLSWGSASAAGQTASSLTVVPGSTFEAGNGESFPVGTLRYFNGVTRAGTNARTATFRVDFALSVPSTTTVSVDIPVRMQNTIHYPTTPSSDYADVLWVPQYTSLSQPITILDKQFAVSILAQAASSVVDGSDIKVSIDENATTDVTLTATVAALN